MIRAVLFDFYGVWLPDIFASYLAEARQQGFEASDELESLVSRYFHGMVDVQEVADTMRFKMNRPDIDARQFILNQSSIAPAIVDFMRELHSHFVKLGVLANLGNQELQLLNDFNAKNQVFEVIAGPLAQHSDQPLLSNEVFAQALQDLGEPPTGCLVVTGSDTYKNFAGSLGMRVLPFEGFPKLRQDLDQLLASDAS
jgi:beta-phosphoglucomutase-like phosphatase (HAD superfamily)